MSFLVADLKSRVARAIGWVTADSSDAWPTGSSTPQFVDIANEAGEWLYSSRQWQFLDSTFEQLNIVAGQDYVELPTDFSGWLAFGPGRNGGITLAWKTPEFVMNQRTYPNQINGTFYVCLGNIEPSSVNPEPRAVLQIGPVSGSTVMEAVQLHYTSKWPRISQNYSASAKLKVPDWMQPLVLLTVIEYLRGYEQSLEGRLDQRLEAILQGPVYRAACARDESLAPVTGPISGTAEEMCGGLDDPFFPGRGREATFV